MLDIILQCLYLMLPAYFANMAPVLVKNTSKKLAFPVDFNRKINNKPIFGKNKTFRGLIFGIKLAIITAFLQFLLYRNNIFTDIAIVDYSNWLFIGLLMGFGAMFGDLIESFVKRRLNYKPGRPFIPFDQTDFVIGALIFAYPVIRISLDKVAIILVLTFVLHIAVNHFAYYTGIRKEKW